MTLACQAVACATDLNPWPRIFFFFNLCAVSFFYEKVMLLEY